ncbi:Hypothetical protein A7982_03299 [Minicystis rosea]|nr:Hypothetical protein A7982_03299 [Minicystis rosea]
MDGKSPKAVRCIASSIDTMSTAMQTASSPQTHGPIDAHPFTPHRARFRNRALLVAVIVVSVLVAGAGTAVAIDQLGDSSGDVEGY